MDCIAENSKNQPPGQDLKRKGDDEDDELLRKRIKCHELENEH